MIKLFLFCTLLVASGGSFRPLHTTGNVSLDLILSWVLVVDSNIWLSLYRFIINNSSKSPVSSVESSPAETELAGGVPSSTADIQMEFLTVLGTPTPLVLTLGEIPVQDGGTETTHRMTSKPVKNTLSRQAAPTCYRAVS